jgi:hypothetical protein
VWRSVDGFWRELAERLAQKGTRGVSRLEPQSTFLSALLLHPNFEPCHVTIVGHLETL